MKILIFPLMLLASAFASAQEIEDAVDQYITDDVPRPNDIMYASIDFGKGANSAALVGQYYNNYDKICGYSWTIYEKINNQWKEPKTRDSANGRIHNDGFASFDFWFAGNVYFEKYHHKGLLYYYPRGRCWTFTYLDENDDTLKSIEFIKASAVGMSEDDLIKLRDLGKLDIKHKLIP